MKASSLPTGAEVRERINATGMRLCLLQAESIKRRVYRGAPLLAAWRDALALTLVSPSVDAPALLAELVARRPTDNSERAPLRMSAHKLVLIWRDIAERGATGNRLPPWAAGLMPMLVQAAQVEPWTEEAAGVLGDLVELHGVVIRGVVETPMAVDILNGPAPWN